MAKRRVIIFGKPQVRQTPVSGLPRSVLKSLEKAA